ncbi:hydroxypyruvate reductase-like [Plectropomus leopardus]|uniref:hydroxypyruvate reductase-like n=1 Tax=Plectropomus leopardus TaxID=160734 RepID=UPI001C4D8394|nr:hydroxypyruvate reductase-like [Plectropomus leopardus]
MENNKPWALISDVEDQGHLKEFIGILKQHFQIVCHKDLLQNPHLYCPKIQVIFVWFLPVPKPSLLSLLPSLKVVASGGAGVDHLDVPYITSLGVKVTNTPDVVSNATADMVMGLLLASARNIVKGHQVAVDPNTNHKSQCPLGVEVKANKCCPSVF